MFTGHTRDLAALGALFQSFEASWKNLCWVSEPSLGTAAFSLGCQILSVSYRAMSMCGASIRHGRGDPGCSLKAEQTDIESLGSELPPGHPHPSASRGDF